MKQFVKMQIILLMVTGFSVGMGSAVALADEQVIAPFQLKVQHLVVGVDEDGSENTRPYKLEEQLVTKPGYVTKLQELLDLGFTGTDVKLPSKASTIQKVVYYRNPLSAHVHLTMVDENGKVVFERESGKKLKRGGSLVLVAPAGYKIIDTEFSKQAVVHAEENWRVRVKSDGTQTKPQENDSNPGPVTGQQSQQGDKSNQTGDKDQQISGQPVTNLIPEKKPQTTPQQPNLTEKPQLLTNTQTPGHTTLQASKPQLISPQNQNLSAMLAKPATSEVDFNHQNPLDWWQPVTGAAMTTNAGASAPKKKRQPQSSSTPEPSKPAGPQAAKAERRQALTHSQAALRVAASKSQAKQLPQTSEQTTPAAILGGIALSSTAGAIIYQFRRRKN